MARQKGTITTVEGWMLANGKAGDVFYSERKDRSLTSSANYNQRKIKTERVIAVSIGGKAESKYITKVTLL